MVPGLTEQREQRARTLLPVHDEHCAVARTAEIVGSKWTMLLVHDLSEGPRRFSELEHACPGISPRTLSERLHMLEREGIVSRRAYYERPPRVEYELTEKGKGLLPIADAMRRFGRAWPCDRHRASAVA
jgi:DNA-binding HxlR family transcriptional regulator